MAFVALAASASASAQEALDANCPGPRDVTFGFDSGPGGNARLAQTFTAQSTGALTTAQADVSTSGTSANWVISINAVDGSGSPTNTVLASTSILDSNVPNGDWIITGSFSSPVTVVAGQQYALVVTRPGSTEVAVGAQTGDVCPGLFFSSSSQTGTFTSSPSNDIVFAVYVTPTGGGTPPGTGAPPDSDTTAPSATITKAPNDKTKKKTATFAFTGTDTRAVASFQCSLDGAPVAICTSPHTVKVKKGKHTFEVRAVDEAGNIGAPASDTWKRKKQK